MAPRGKSRKLGNSRMAVAIDTMAERGWPDRKLVRSKINELLKEYGGFDCFPFIEADAYKVLSDELVADAEKKLAKSTEEKTSSKGDSSDANRAENEIAAPSVGNAAESSNAALINTDLGGNKGKDTCSSNNGATDDSAGGCPAEEVRPHDSPPLLSPASHGVSTRTRKPCYGWIDEDDEDGGSDYLVYLTPAVRTSRTPLTEAQVKGPKRKSRWDQRPEDL